MPRYVVKQPNGLYAFFSTIVDDFTALDCTRQQAIDHGMDFEGWPAIDAVAKVERADDEDPPGDGTYLSRWRAAIETVRAIHGSDLANERRSVGGATKTGGGEP